MSPDEYPVPATVLAGRTGDEIEVALRENQAFWDRLWQRNPAARDAWLASLGRSRALEALRAFAYEHRRTVKHSPALGDWTRDCPTCAEIQRRRQDLLRRVV